jgi:hypothetical protein
MPPNTPSGQPLAPKKTSVWVWILGGIAIFFFAIMLTCGVVGYLGMRMIKNAGFDSELMKNNPGLAMAKMATAVNRNLEVVSTNDRTGTIVVRDKTTGKVTTMKFDPDTKRMVITGDDGKQSSVTVNGSGGTGSVSVESADGSSVKYGNAAGNNVPSWVPAYPGWAPQGTISATNAEGSQNTFSFKSTDPASKILSFYSDQLKAAGFTISMTTTSDQGGLVQANDDAKKHTISVIVGTSPDGTETAITAIEKK